MLVDLVGGEHHLYGPVRRWGYGIRATLRGAAATTDANLLTRIVVLAHDRAIRAALDSGGPRGLALMLWKRTREGDFCDRHPTLEDHAAAIRERVRPCKIYGVDS